MKKIVLLSTGLLLTTATSFGAGFQINAQGVRQVAMAGNGTGWVWDASTIFYNPGALARLKNVQAYGSVNFLLVNTQYASSQTGYSQYAKQGFYTPFNVYVGGPIRPNGKLALGLGIYTPFGSGMKWKDDWAGRYLVQNIQMSTFFFQPTASYRLGDVVSIGGGFIYALGNVKVQRALPVQDANGNDATTNLKGGAEGIGFNLGVHIRAGDKVQFGVNYRSEVKMKVRRGKASFNVPSGIAAEFPNTGFTSEVPLPQVVAFGLGVRPTENLTITAQVDWMGWNSFDSLRFNFDEHTSTLHDIHAAREYKNTVAIRLGLHYQVVEKLALMLGAAYDPTPVTDGFVSPDLPDANRVLVTGGFTVKATERLNILAGIEYGRSEKRKASYLPENFNGTYQTKALVPTIGITYDFK